jgi:hypothetical protein
MSRSKCVAALAASALLACAGLVQAEQPASPEVSSSPIVLQPKYLDDAAAPAGPTSLLNEGIKKIGGGFLLADPYDLKFGAFIEGGYTLPFNDPPGHVLPGRVFDFQADHVILDQADFSFERDVNWDNAKKGKFDIGGKVEFMYGGDAGLIHSNGILDNYNGAHSPDNQPDLTQAYMDFLLPIGSGLDIRAGKFVTLLGYETINPTTNPLFSRSFEFGFAIPFTNTGVLGTYNLTDKLTITAGITRGWEQSSKDTNSSIDVMGQVKYVHSDVLTLYFNGIVGPEKFHNNHDYRAVMDIVANITPKNSNWTFGLNPFVGYEEHASTSGGDAYWYGVVGYAGYKINDYVTANGRLEWFRDDGGSRFAGNPGASYYEGTLGVTVKPFPHDLIGQNFEVRPEVRYDVSNKKFFDGGNEKDQATFGVDAIFNF